MQQRLSAPRTVVSGRISRVSRALELRDDALNILWRHGARVDFGPLKLLQADLNGLSIAHRTPFLQPLLTGRNNWALPFGLDIWTRKRKVMNLEWGLPWEVQLVSFRSGEWEEQLTRISTALSAWPPGHA